MYFPVADISANPLLLVGVAAFVSFFTSMAGISGAFLLLPFQMSFLGYTHPSLSATNQFYNIVAVPSGVWRYIKEGRMVWPLALLISVGTLPGVFLGAIIRITYLPDPQVFKLFAGSVLLLIAFRLVQDIVKPKNAVNKQVEERFNKKVLEFKADKQKEQLFRTQVCSFSWQKLVYQFYEEKFTVPVRPVFLLSLVVGIIGGAYGIGGGAIIAPILTSYFALPTYTVASASLTATLVTSVAGVLFFTILAPFFPEYSISPDWSLGLCLGLGGMLGMYFGAKTQKYVSSFKLKLFLCFTLFFTALKYIWDFF